MSNLQLSFILFVCFPFVCLFCGCSWCKILSFLLDWSLVVIVYLSSSFLSIRLLVQFIIPRFVGLDHFHRYSKQESNVLLIWIWFRFSLLKFNYLFLRFGVERVWKRKKSKSLFHQRNGIWEWQDLYEFDYPMKYLVFWTNTTDTRLPQSEKKNSTPISTITRRDWENTWKNEIRRSTLVQSICFLLYEWSDGGWL